MSVFESAAACPLSTQNDPSSVRILRPSAKVSPEPIIPTLVSEPELAPRCVFGVALETLRQDGQMVCGIPLVLRDMVQFLDKNGNLGSSLLLFICHFSAILSLFLFFASHCPSLFLSLSQCTTVLTILTESFCLLVTRNAAQRSVPSVWLSVEDQAAEAAVGRWGEGGPGA